MEQYYASVGRGANFLNALVPDKRGLIDEAQAKTVAQFGAEVRRRFGQPIARTDSSKGWLEPGVLEIAFGGQEDHHVVLEEEIAKGQHVLKYAVEVLSEANGRPLTRDSPLGESESSGSSRRSPPRRSARVVQANAIPSIGAMTVFDR